MTTYSSSGSRQSERAYYAFGDNRRTVNTPLTDNLFTGQKQDESGLYYYNARYYDPEIGHFISPDTLVPDPGSVFGYNRYMYAMGNPLKFNDPSGRFSEQQLIEWYGENWRDQFAAEWQKLLLDDPGSSNFGAQLGDLVAYGDSQGILVLDPDNQLALWDFNAKSAQTVASVGASTPDSLGLYRVKSGLSGENTGRFPTGGETLAATQGSGVGPYDMELLPGYSTAGMGYHATVPADWFMGNSNSGYYVNNRMEFDEVDLSINVVVGSSASLIGAAIEASKFIPGIGAVTSFTGAGYAVYDLLRFRPIYEMQECPTIGPAWCQ
ncbi:MAG: RHS repeat-associated core domain-containing protein [Caldilineaceae bacterium]|nr:RHS repeat-associated core domain-containing protein [Caldilineaceae bacterium]